MADAVELLDREIDAAGYDPIVVAATVALGVLIDARNGRVDLWTSVRNHLRSPYMVEIHPNTAKAIADDRAGLRRAVRRFLTVEAEETRRA